MGGAAHEWKCLQLSVAHKYGDTGNSFSLPQEVFKLGLGQGPLLVYLYLICRKSLKRGVDEMSCAVIGKAVGMCVKTVRTHLRTLAGTGVIKMEYYGRTFSYTLCPIQYRVREYRSTTPHNRWMLSKQVWLTGEEFDAVFPLPNEVFQLGLKGGSLLVYIYLQYQKGVRSGQCWPSYATIGAAVGMSRKTVQRHVCALVDKELVATENTSVFSRGLKVNGNLRYTLKPIWQVLKEREDEMLVELKLAETQRKWNQHCLNRDRPRSPL